MKKNKSLILIHIALLIGVLAMILPFVWMVLTSFKTYAEATRIPITIFPEVFRTENFTKAGDLLPFGRLYYNTVVLMVGRVVCAIVFSSMAGYAFGRIKFPGRGLLFTIVLIQMMVPSQVFVIPQFLLVMKLGWLNSLKALIVPGVVSAFGTFLLRQFFMGLPKELEDAAILDGCNQWKIFTKIMFPLAKSGMVALSIFTALFAWKDLLWPLIVNMEVDKMTLAAGLATLKGQYLTDYPVIMAGSLIAIWPMVVVFFLFQKQFIQGIAFTGSKG